MPSRPMFREFNSCVKNWNHWYLEPVNFSAELVTRSGQTQPVLRATCAGSYAYLL